MEITIEKITVTKMFIYSLEVGETVTIHFPNHTAKTTIIELRKEGAVVQINDCARSLIPYEDISKIEN
jgi:sRNA-binding protein